MSLKSKKVYITAAVIAGFVDRANPKHEYIAAFFRYFALKSYMLYTDSIMLNDCYRSIAQDISPSLAKDVLRTIFLSDINILYPIEPEIKAAMKVFIGYQSADLTFPKAIMAVLCERHSIPQVYTLEYLHPLFGLTPFSLSL